MSRIDVVIERLRAISVGSENDERYWRDVLARCQSRHVSADGHHCSEIDGSSIAQDMRSFGTSQAPNTEFVQVLFRLRTSTQTFDAPSGPRALALKRIKLSDLHEILDAATADRLQQNEFADRRQNRRRMLRSTLMHGSNDIEVLFSSLQHRAFSGQL